MAGLNVSVLIRAVDRITAPLRSISASTGKLGQAQQELRQDLSRVGGQFQEQIKQLRNLSNAAENAQKSISKVTGAAGSLATKATVGVAAVTAAVTMLNQSTVERETLAKSLGVDIAMMENLAGAVAGAGFNFDNVVDLVEEMNNKLGESAGIEELTPVKEALQILGLEYQNIKDLAPEEQFKMIADAALNMGDAQQAAAAMDILMGGEANKMIGVLRQRGASIDEITKAQAELNFMTAESRQGASLFGTAFASTQKIIASLSSHIAGLAGKHLTPLIEKMNQYLITNKELINTKLNEFFANLVPKISQAVNSFNDVVNSISSTIALFGGFKNILMLIAGLMVGKLVVSIVAMTSSLVTLGIAAAPVFAGLISSAWAFTAALLANPITWVVAGVVAGVATIAASAYLIYKNWGAISDFFAGIWQGIKEIFTGGLSFIMDKIRSVANLLPSWALPDSFKASINTTTQSSEDTDINSSPDGEVLSTKTPLTAGNRTQNNSYNTQVTINAPDGTSAQGIAEEFNKLMQQREKQQQVQQRGALYDY